MSGREPFLENLALAACGVAKTARRDTRGPVESPHEVREVPKADIERDVRDRPIVAAEERRGTSQARAHDVLVRRHAEHAGEEPEEMIRAQSRVAGGAAEIDFLVRVLVEP